MSERVARRNKRAAREKRRRSVRKRAVSRIAVMLMLCTAAALGVSAVSTAMAKDTEYFTVTVSSGDTLWEIAARYNVKNKDIRSVVNEIASANGISASGLRAGETIRVPVQR